MISAIHKNDAMTAAMANIAVSGVCTAPVRSRLSFALKKAMIAIIVIIIVHILFDSFLS